MIAEGSSSSSQTPVPRGGSSQPPSERDLLAERRARRAAESGENALLRRAEMAESTVKTLEGHVASLQRRLQEAEQDGRRTSELAQRLENVEGALAAIRESHRRMASTVSELKGVAMRLRTAVDAEPARESSSVRPRSEEMADALAAAVERLRARAQESVAVQADRTPSGVPVSSVPPVARTPHKHSMSLIGRWRLRRKQRRGR
jgi:chromosome segregation ATPase